MQTKKSAIACAGLLLFMVTAAARANPQILYYSDGSLAADQMAVALSDLSGTYTTTVATSTTNFTTQIATDNYALGIFSEQENSGAGYTAAFAALATFVQDGGKAIVVNWYQPTAAELTPFGGTPTGDENAATVNLSAFNSGITNPVLLTNPGYADFSYGLTLVSTVGTSIAATFSDPGNASGANGQAAIVTGNDGRSIVNGFLEDTFVNDTQGVQLYENEINAVIAIPEPASAGMVLGAAALFAIRRPRRKPQLG